MQATADSRMVRIKGTLILKRAPNVDSLNKEFPKRDIKRCPAIRLAVSRTHNVIGRIIFLVSSIKTINLIRAIGVPWGTRWLNIWFVFFSQPNKIIASQNTKERGRVTARWEVKEKSWGYKAAKFINRIEKKMVIIKGRDPFSVFLRVNLTSLENVEKIFFNPFKVVEVNLQKERGIKQIPIKKISQEEEK
jgi:hypothetical protein